MKWVKIVPGEYALYEGDTRLGNVSKVGAYWYWWLAGDTHSGNPCTTLRQARVAVEGSPRLRQ